MYTSQIFPPHLQYLLFVLQRQLMWHIINPLIIIITIYLWQRRRYMFSPTHPCSFVSVSLCSTLLKNACMDLDEMLHVDRCRDMDERITSESNPDNSPDANLHQTRTQYSNLLLLVCVSWTITGLLPPISYRLRKFAALPSLAYFSANLAYYSAFSVSICTKLACSILIFFFLYACHEP